jgi:hypothetical protein
VVVGAVLDVVQSESENERERVDLPEQTIVLFFGFESFSDLPRKRSPPSGALYRFGIRTAIAGVAKAVGIVMPPGTAGDPPALAFDFSESKSKFDAPFSPNETEFMNILNFYVILHTSSKFVEIHSILQSTRDF